MAVEEKKLCPRCMKMLKLDDYYTCRDGTKTELCKKCMTAHVDNFNPDTYIPLLMEVDVPYIKEEWDVLLDRAVKSGKRLNGMSVFGKYIGKMKLRQWSNYGYADTKRLQDERNAQIAKEQEKIKKFEEKIERQYRQGKITEEEYKIAMNHDAPDLTPPPPEPPTSYEDAIGENNEFQDDAFIPEEALPKQSLDLTEEDKIYLAMKWGRMYKADDWIALEKKYSEMKESFDISDSDTEGTLILICKTYLKMNQAIDEGDLDSYQKLSRTYDSLRKSAKFTAAQKGEEESQYVDCVGNLVAYCEKRGGAIPRYDIHDDKDIIDTIIKDMKNYTRELIYEDSSIAAQVETYLKRRQAAESKIQDEEDAERLGIDFIPISDKDMTQHFHNISLDMDEDKEVYNEDRGIGQ